MNNIKIPSREECLAILIKNKTPSNIIEHCKTVCKVAEKAIEKLIARGVNINKKLVIAAALLHDIERQKKNHIVDGVKLLKSMGFKEVAEVIKKHSLYKIEDEDVQPNTIEEKIVFYADKRSNGNKIVSLKDRFEDLRRRYNHNFIKEFKFAKMIEEDIRTYK